MPVRARAVVTAVPHVVAGALTGLLGLLVHRQGVVADLPAVGVVVLPWGLALVLLAFHLGTRAAVLTGGVRSGAWSFAGGITAVLLAATFPSSTGDVLLAEDVRGYGLLLGGAVVVGLALVRATARPNVGA